MSGKTWLIGQIGDIEFPMTPTSIDGMTIGSSTPKAGSFTALSATSNVNLPTITRTITALSTAAHPAPNGVFTVPSTAAKTYTMGPNVTGGGCELLCTSSGTASKKVQFGAGVSIFGFLSSAAGSSKPKTSLNFTGKGQSVTLRALSSAALYVTAKQGNVASS